MSDEAPKSDKTKLDSSRSSAYLLVVVLIAAIIAVLVYNATKSSNNSPANNVSNSNNGVVDRPIAGASGLYLSPSSGTYATGSYFNVQIRENSSQTMVNAVQANLTYPTNFLKLTNVNDSAGKFKIQAQNQSASGVINLARGSTSPLLGDQLVAQVTFQAISPGQASLTFVSGSALVSASSHQSIIKNLPAPVTYTIR